MNRNTSLGGLESSPRRSPRAPLVRVAALLSSLGLGKRRRRYWRPLLSILITVSMTIHVTIVVTWPAC
jgi:hypothetical protein